VSALLGAVSVLLGDGLVTAAATLIVGAGALVAYQRTHERDPGMTTEFALVLTCLLGGFAIHNPILAAAVGVTLALLLAERNRIHHFVLNVLTAQELSDIILFAAMALIVLPLAPDRYMGPLDALNPHALVRLIVLVMAISALGYVAMRTLGTRYGLPLAGFASGLSPAPPPFIPWANALPTAIHHERGGGRGLVLVDCNDASDGSGHRDGANLVIDCADAAVDFRQPGSGRVRNTLLHDEGAGQRRRRR
jgi:uncharacterized membrane protein (DUF4010 family)